MVYYFSDEQGWGLRHMTSIPYSMDEVQLSNKGFKWPEWAIQKVNDLGSNLQAIKIVSKLLDEERKKQNGDFNSYSINHP